MDLSELIFTFYSHILLARPSENNVGNNMNERRMQIAIGRKQLKMRCGIWCLFRLFDTDIDESIDIHIRMCVCVGGGCHCVGHYRMGQNIVHACHCNRWTYWERERTKVQFSRRVVTQTNSSLQTEVKRILSDKKTEREREKERKSLMYNENPTYWRDRIF